MLLKLHLLWSLQQ